ncbi:MAG: hypothetical protein A2287_07150 [Candidatus Melainabacteria bacterium RIFOXYA12_FULL_32_12]|nr:MAG: hypothetical protein A2255_00090 [Candidatus Melainabacteria bacterium RIFOXYA2_FULL_32_9]OGI26990.1 MAG: hypothetical protein A2287_07150 [Candidatus Melainabacteria bacterium RIFOXYA12_FULL_32_12]
MSLINSLVQFVAGTKAVASEVNSNFETLRTGHNDQEARISTVEGAYVKKDGTVAMAGALNMGSHKITALTNGADTNDAVNKGQLDTKAELAGASTQVFEAADGSTGKQVVNISQFVNSLAASGYHKLPSGLIIQWQKETSIAGLTYRTVTFPISFPTAVVAILPSRVLNYAASLVGVITVDPTNTTLSGTRIGNCDNASADAYIVSIGY